MGAPNMETDTFTFPPAQHDLLNLSRQAEEGTVRHDDAPPYLNGNGLRLCVLEYVVGKPLERYRIKARRL